MKDGRTHLAHNAEHAVDMETGAIVAVTLHGADEGDTQTIQETVAEAGERITTVVADSDSDEVAEQVSAEGPREVVTDKGYHGQAVVRDLTEWGVRTYCSEPNRGPQRWEKQPLSPQAASTLSAISRNSSSLTSPRFSMPFSLTRRSISATASSSASVIPNRSRL